MRRPITRFGVPVGRSIGHGIEPAIQGTSEMANVIIYCRETKRVERGERIYEFKANQPTSVRADDAVDLLQNPLYYTMGSFQSSKSDTFMAGKAAAKILYTDPAHYDRDYLVSVIIPCYNYEKYLEEAIESVLSQDFESFELLLVDNKSLDNTRAIILEFAHSDSRVVAIGNTGVGGVAHTRNIGILASVGDLICFLDADDVMVPGRLKSQVRCFLEEPDLDFVYGHAKSFDGSPCWVDSSEDPDVEKLAEYDYIPACSPMFKRKILNITGLQDIRLPAAEDWEFYGRILASGFNCRYVPEVTYKLRQHPDSKTIRDSRYINDKKWMQNISKRIVNYDRANHFLPLGRPINVLFVVPGGGLGGANVATVDLLRHINRKEFNPHVYMMQNFNYDFLAEELEKLGVEYEIQSEPYYADTSHASDIGNLYSYISEHNIDIVHNVIVRASRDAAKKAGIPILQMRHQMDYTVSMLPEETHVSICNVGIQDDDMFQESHVLPNGVDHVFFSRVPDAKRYLSLMYGVNEKCKVLLWAGRASKGKRPELFLDLMDMLGDKYFGVFLLIHGDDNYSDLLNRSSSMGNVVNPDPVAPREMLRFYSGADFVVNTSIEEGNGLTLMEGMSCETVPVAFAVGGIPDYIISGYNGILCDHINDIASAIRETSDDLLGKMGKRARISIQRNHDLLQTVSRYEFIYKQALSRFGGNS